MKNIIILLLAIVTLSSCKKSNSKPSGVYKAVGIWLEFKNANGQNLLDPSIPNSIKANDISVYLLKNGEKVEIDNPYMRTPKNFKIVPSSDPSKGNVMQFYFQEYAESYPDDKITMFIKHKDGTEYKLTGQFYVKFPTIAILKLWVNDTLKWESQNNVHNAHAIIVK